MGFLENLEASRHQRRDELCPIRDMIDHCDIDDDDGEPLKPRLVDAVDGPWPIEGVARAIRGAGLTRRAQRTVSGWVSDHRKGRCACV